MAAHGPALPAARTSQQRRSCPASGPHISARLNHMSNIAFISALLCVLVVAYVYAGYPVLLVCGFLRRRRPVYRGEMLPSVSVIIPAHNEEDVIEEKPENIAGFAYPRELVEVLVGSDGATDGTADAVRQHTGVILYESPSQSGKSAIQNELVMRSSGEILLFTDAVCF